MKNLTQNQTAEPLTFLMTDSTDHISPKTGLSPTVTLSKNGGSFASPSGAVSEIGNGWYKVAGNATDANTLGPLLLHATATGADASDERFQVVSFNTQDTVRGTSGTALPNAAAAATGGIPILGVNTGTVTLNAVIVQAGSLTLGAGTLTLNKGTLTLDGGIIGNITGTVSVATLVNTLTTYTGNTPQTGDTYARVGAAGAGLTALGDSRLGNLDAAVSSRMATYTQPTGFLAATFPAGTIASTTNITAGTIATVTTLTNLPAITAGWLTATGIAAAALNGKGDWATVGAAMTLSGDFSATMKTSLNAVAMTAGTLTLVNTLTTYTGNTLQTGDAFARLGAPAGASVAADIASFRAATASESEIATATAAQITSDHGSGNYASSGGSGLTAQQTRDALLLPATAPANAANGSIDAQLAVLRGGRVVPRSPVTEGGQYLLLVRGDDYTVASGQALEWTDEAGNWPELPDGTTITLTVRVKDEDGAGDALALQKTGTVVTGTGDDKLVRVQPTHSDTADLVPGNRTCKFDVVAVLAGSGAVVTLRNGEATVLENQTRS